jgi:hypothetical protein
MHGNYEQQISQSTEPERPIRTRTIDSKPPDHHETSDYSATAWRFVKEDVYARKWCRKVQFLATEFWKRWLKEYMLHLQIRTKWNKITRNLTVGDIVILKDEDLVRSTWSLARVVDTMVDADGFVRRVKVLLGDATLEADRRRVSAPTVLERPIHKLVVLLENQ